MPTLLRITLLAVPLAIGIAVALAVAIRRPPQRQWRTVAAHADAAASQPLAPPSGSSQPKPDGMASPHHEGFAEPVPVVAPYRDPVARQVGQLAETIQEIEESSLRRERSLLRAIAHVQNQIDSAPAPAVVPPAQPPPPPAANPPVDELPLPGAGVHRGEGDDRFTINIQNTDIRTVLESLSQEAGLNILASKNVAGPVTANLTGVDVETALAAILKTTGFVAHREGSIIYVGTPQDLILMNQAQDRIVTRVYRPNYVKAADLQALFTQLLTPTVGKITVSSPSQEDIPSDQNKSGGISYAGTDAVVVRDYETVLAEMDQIFAEVDAKPRQVAIEAMILSVKLSDTFKLGVNFEALRDTNNARLISGSPPTSLSDIALDGGLKFGFMDASLTLFIDALEKIGDTNVIAAPRLTCLNKQRAEIQIGEELGYISTTVTESSATQTVNFLDVGTLLRIRPHISNDGLIRLEVHPELSTGSVTVQQGLSLPQKAVTQVTTNVLCPDGCTVIIGGLIREDLTTDTSQIPLLGSLPWIGPVFRQTTQGVDRNEIIVLITPRIVSEPFMCQEGMKYGNDFTQRQSIYFNKMSPIGKRNLGQHHLRMARAAYNAGNYETAIKQVNLAIHYDPLNRDAIPLRNEIVAAGGFEDESIHEYLHHGLAPLSGRHRDYSRLGYPWKEFEGFGPPEVSATDDPGLVGPARTIVRPPPLPRETFRGPISPTGRPLDTLPPARPMPGMPGANER